MFVKQYSLKTDGDIKLQEHFRVKEFACKDGTDKILIDVDGVMMLEDLRTLINKPIHINSGYRTENYNKSIDGAENSYHVKGQAFDISVDGIPVRQLALYASRIKFNGIIVYNNFIHLDTRDKIYYSI